MTSVSDDKAVTTLADAQESNAVQLYKDQKVHSYTTEFKLNAIKKAEETFVHHAATFNVEAKQIREWQKKKNEIAKLAINAKGMKLKQLQCCGRKLLTTEMENYLFDWIAHRRSKKSRVSRITIMKKVNLMCKKIEEEDTKRLLIF